jgi:uncharacterized protein YjbJ (UPF0337 family)
MDRINGIGHQILGALKSGLGSLFGDAKLQTEGKIEQESGKPHGAGDTIGGLDADRVEGIGHQLRGAAKQGFGKIVGDAEIVADGAGERARGAVQNEIGSARDEARDAIAAAGQTPKH